MAVISFLKRPAPQNQETHSGGGTLGQGCLTLGGSLSSVCKDGTSHGVCSMADGMMFTPYPFIHACYLLSLIQCSTLLRISYRYMIIPLPLPQFYLLLYCPQQAPLPNLGHIYIMTNSCCPCLLGVGPSTGAREIYQGPDPHKRMIPTLSSNPLPIAPHLRSWA